MNFSERNKRRCESPDGFNHPLGSWTLSDWMTATLGELGEAANIVKKMNRHRDGIAESIPLDHLRQMLSDELADAEIYMDLLFQAAGIDRAAAIENKFLKTSDKIGYV
jgi:NTP pyrophosphatase (non-canonical NTP hydrolase)